MKDRGVTLVLGGSTRNELGISRRKITAELLSPLLEITHFGRIAVRTIERIFFQLSIRERQAKAIAEQTQSLPFFFFLLFVLGNSCFFLGREQCGYVSFPDGRCCCLPMPFRNP